jgi:hypothetical protein
MNPVLYRKLAYAPKDSGGGFFAGDPSDGFQDLAVGSSLEGVESGEGWIGGWAFEDVAATSIHAYDDWTSYAGDADLNGGAGGDGWSGNWTASPSSTVLRKTLADGSDIVRFTGAGGILRSIGTDWEHIRIATAFMCEDTGGNIANNPLAGRWAVGLCSGTTNPYHPTNSVDNFVGYISSDFVWSRIAFSTFAEYSISGFSATKVGTTQTNSTGISNRLGSTLGRGGAAKMSCLCLDFIKGSPNWTINAFFLTNGNSYSFDYSHRDNLFKALTVDSRSSGAVGTTETNGISIAVDEGTNGSLDHVNIYWPLTNYLDMQSLLVLKFK